MTLLAIVTSKKKNLGTENKSLFSERISETDEIFPK